MTEERWQPPEGWDEEEETARYLNVAVSTLKRWRRQTRKTGRQIGPPFSYTGLGRGPIYHREKLQAWLQSNGPRPPRKQRPRGRITATTAEATP
jgi:transposase-like protein